MWVGRSGICTSKTCWRQDPLISTTSEDAVAALATQQAGVSAAAASQKACAIDVAPDLSSDLGGRHVDHCAVDVAPSRLACVDALV